MQTAVIPALEVDGVSHAYGARKALDNVSLKILPGQFCVLLGLNGAGKSTLFSLVTRLFGLQSGSVRIFGHDAEKSPGEALRRMGVVFQARTLDLDLSIQQNLAYHAALHGLGAAQCRKLAHEALAKVGLGDRAAEKARSLSGGQMRRVEIARALLHQPRLLLLDEPTVGLDIQARSGILGHVRHLVAQTNIGVLWTTHLLDEIEANDAVVVLHRGKVLDSGRAGDICQRTGAANIRAAFASLTGSSGMAEAAA